MILKGKLCILRPWVRDDIWELASLANNRKIFENLRDFFPHPYTYRDSATWVEYCIRNNDPVTHFAIESDHCLAGSAGITLLHDVYKKNAEIGYWLGEDFWNRGIITEAISLLIKYIFETFDATRIFAELYSGNIGSQRALEKNGFRREAFFRSNIFKMGKFRDSMIYALLKQEYEVSQRKQQK